jgi:hypothetical protein
MYVVPEHEHLHGGSYARKSQGYADVGWNAGLKQAYIPLRSEARLRATVYNRAGEYE